MIRMTEKRFTSKKYNDYPVIIDNNDNTELTLDSVVELLNDYEFCKKHDIKEFNQLYKSTEYAISRRKKMESQRNNLIYLIIFMGVMILIETLWIIRGV